MKHGKKYNESLKLVDLKKRYEAKEACDLAKQTAKTKYDSTIRVAIKLNVDPKQADQQIRGALVLPNGTGKTQKVLVVTSGAKEDEAKNAGADFVGGKEICDKIKGGWLDFDVLVATPDMMGELGKLGKILGPKGLMPNPKTGTVTMNIAQAVTDVKKGKIEYRVDAAGNINVNIGKASFSADALADNYNTLFNAIAKARPSTVKGAYIQNVSISADMGPGIKVAYSVE